MPNLDKQIPFRITLLLTGYFLQKLTQSEQNELDYWVDQSIENQQLFEACVEMTARPVRPHDDADTAGDIRYIADLFMKKVTNKITPAELAILDDWKGQSNIDPLLLQSLEASPSIEMLYERLKMHFHNMNRN